MEELVSEGGRVANPSFTRYRLPTALGAPEIRIAALLEERDVVAPSGPRLSARPPRWSPRPPSPRPSGRPPAARRAAADPARGRRRRSPRLRHPPRPRG